MSCNPFKNISLLLNQDHVSIISLTYAVILEYRALRKSMYIRIYEHIFIFRVMALTLTLYIKNHFKQVTLCSLQSHKATMVTACSHIVCFEFFHFRNEAFRKCRPKIAPFAKCLWRAGIRGQLSWSNKGSLMVCVGSVGNEHQGPWPKAERTVP